MIVEYRVDFARMKQTNAATGFGYDVRRGATWTPCRAGVQAETAQPRHEVEMAQPCHEAANFCPRLLGPKHSRDYFKGALASGAFLDLRVKFLL